LASSAAGSAERGVASCRAGRPPISDALTQAIGRIGVTAHKAVINYVAAERCRARATVPASGVASLRKRIDRSENASRRKKSKKISSEREFFLASLAFERMY
jgi:hypothetical protein